jgi:hypothetical protein
MRKRKLVFLAILTCGTALQFSGCMSAARFLYRNIGNLSSLLTGGGTTDPGSTI